MFTLLRRAATISAAVARSTPAPRSAVSSVSPRFKTTSVGSGAASGTGGGEGAVGASATTGGAGSRVGTATPIAPRASSTAAAMRQCERLMWCPPGYRGGSSGRPLFEPAYAPYLVNRSAFAITSGIRSWAGITPSEPPAQSRSVNRLTRSAPQ
jgi:hypothetical protein